MSASSSNHVLVKKARPKTSVVFDTYWKFAYLRQEAFYARLYKPQGPWSEDKVINEFKFTNAYRASDRVSQYLIKNVIYSKPWSLRDTVLRILLFKFFNKIETWQLLEKHFGEVSLKTFSVEAYSKVLQQAMDKRISIYSAAYIIPSGSKREFGGKRKHDFHLTLLRSLLESDFIDDLIACKTMRAAYQRILEIESLGKFLAYQFVTDLNYSDYFQFSEQEFVVPGPGALDGIRKCFTDLGDFTETDIIHFMMENQEQEFKQLECPFQNLWGRDLQLIDCQNLFCEVDKYARVAHPDIMGISGRVRIKQKFKPLKAPLEIWYPPKWGLNERISGEFSYPKVALM
jgi:hypothetical protein